MTQPVLYIFAISHYCEKARWALDHFGIAYKLQHIMPGMNRKIAKKFGSKAGSLPFLQIGDKLVTGSSGIIDWGEGNRAAGRNSLQGQNANQNEGEIAALEKRLDDILGVHIRRFYYSDALLTDPASVRPIFSNDLPFFHKMGMILGWRKIVPVMIKLMDLGPEQGKQSRDIIAEELDWLDGLLSDGRAYLTGDSFTRADLTAASLLAPLISPPQHPTYSALKIPPGIEAVIDKWRSRPVMQWSARMYAQHR
jgi:glutathione S-transferase